ncbi:hypothetical protein VSS37_13165 [Candidatus Thiothrix sp. Deng01]|uniref:Uncharacterized protein n=1 Tax=Candidatus Thiothrix phosphatis TaxID=3112415 RepID=A0ABU6CZD7_9GAMM|nr:hypothetical protein [Candidatus Thiothrix sp. Deng01]MEB4591936.1 hypothetical protein [Candidatus Thiothrix sp. Deng01]
MSSFSKLFFNKPSLLRTASPLIMATLLALPPVIGAEETQCNNPGTQALYNTFVGMTDTDETAIAINTGLQTNDIGNIDALVYICDGVAQSAWYYGYLTGNELHAMSATGKTVHATVNDNNISGTLEMPDGSQTTFTAPSATGVAGIYLLEGNKGIAANYSVINADIVNAEVTGSVTSSDNQTTEFNGNIEKFGDPANRSTWIVQPNGDVKGRNGGDAVGIPKNCSIWAWTKGKYFGVDCHAYMLPN